MVRVIDAPRLVLAAGTPPKTITEYIGREASGTEPLSIAMMKSPPGWSEPGQTPEFDEYTLVLSGTVDLITRSGTVHLFPGQAAIAPAGEWIQYSTPEGAEYVAVCLPAFSTNIVHRDGETGSLRSDKTDLEIIYEQSGPEGLDLVENLWNQLKEHHAGSARHFKEQLLNRTYTERKADIIGTNAGRSIRVYLAKVKESEDIIGFCVCSGAPGEYGEIESIYVQPDYRYLGIGTKFMGHVDIFFDDIGVTEHRVGVCDGNEDSFRFYERFGFYPRRHLLIRKQVNKS